MTQQAKPHLYFHEQEYLIIKISDKYAFSDFFNPKDYGFSPFCTDTSCWSGFKCQYSILDNNLFITNVEINESTEFKPLLFGREPLILENWGNGKKCKLFYRNVKHPIPYTGDFIIATNFINRPGRKRYNPFYLNYEIILQLTFENGRLTATINHSDSLEEVRLYMDNHDDMLPSNMPPIDNHF